MNVLEDSNFKLGVIGLGYVGLPLAVSFSKKYRVIGFDSNKKKIEKLKNGIDYTNEIEDINLLKNEKILFTENMMDLFACKAYIVAVPTPIDKGNKPDLNPLISACNTLGEIIKSSDEKPYICFESTVYPGCTEEDCIPIIEKVSEKKHGIDFFIGYSPERINPGDKNHKFESIVKVVSGCCEDSKNFFATLYSSVITAGVYIASSIKVAEAAKVIENTQRDINIALINELAIIFSKLNIDTKEVLTAAQTKWNFLNFSPGLVGGHCIGVDPYYLTHKAETVGYIPKVILAGRAINDSMGCFIASESIKLVLKSRPKNLEYYKALILGFSFKENVSDVRNTKVINIVNTLKSYSFHVDIMDPIADSGDALHEYNIELYNHNIIDFKIYDCIFFAVPHLEFNNLIDEIINESNFTGTFIDVKSMLSKNQIDKIKCKMQYWRV
ncbi:nucleotide sugar dehydrogenase [Fluviispira multicolorata]|uniref:Nucleotide sugar dehydrogenase n=2 Tax=Fluviispira multicolorata TaxID=2654512 RepID=A0A833N5P6_9BACT|nr:nucleotide sugar dehydrogenase [Fluviispira multicolorata]